MKRLSVGFVIAMGMASWATGQTSQPIAPSTRPTAPSTRPATGEVAELIRQVSADDEVARKAAIAKLVELGEPVEGDLAKAERRAAEIQSRLEVALKEVQLNGRLGPTRITLHVKDAPFQSVLDELSKQSKVKVEMQNRGMNPDAGKVTLDIDNQPFWLAMKEICEKTGIGPAPYNYGRSDQIVMMPGSGFAKYPAMASGPFYVIVQSASRSHGVTYGEQASRNASAYLQMQVYIDPRLKVVRGTYNLMQPEIVDEKGNSLTNDPGYYGPSYTNYQGYMHQMNVQMRYQEGFGQKITKLKGKMQYMVRSKSEKWEVPDILAAKNLTKELPIGKFIIKQVTKNNDNQYTVQVQIQRGAKATAQNEALLEYGAIQGSMKLLDAQGKSWSNSGGGGGRNNNIYDYSFSFYKNGPENPGPPVKLVWEIATDAIELTVPVEFRDLKLP